MLPCMRRFGLSLTGRMDRADDLVQDACERAISRAHQFQPGTRFDSWLFSIMHSIWKNTLRSEKVRAAEGDDVLASQADALAHKRPEDRVALTEIEKLMMTLPAEQRDVLMLVSVEGLSYKEAASVLDWPIGTVMSRVSRGRLALAKAYQA